MLLRLSASEFIEIAKFDPLQISPIQGVAGVIIEDSLDVVGLPPLESIPCAVIAMTSAPSVLERVDTYASPIETEQLELVASSYPTAFATAARVVRCAEQLGIRDGLFLESVTYSLLQTAPEFQDWLSRNRRLAHRVGRQSDVVGVRRTDDRLDVVLKEPDRRNAFSFVMRDEIRQALTLAVVDRSINYVVISGDGVNFSSGGDLAEFGFATSAVSAHHARTTDSVPHLLSTITDRLGTDLEIRVHGENVGAGVELAAFAGHLIADPATTFRLPEVSMGLIPGSGGTVSLTRRVGRHRAALMILSGMVVDAPTALAWGLVDEIREWNQ